MSQFRLGERVRVKLENPQGNPRTPAYVRRKEGTVVSVHGIIANPLDHRGLYPPLYSVMFTVRDLFGSDTDDRIWVDIHEEWLEMA